MCGYFFKERFLIRCLCKISKTYRPHKNTLWDHINGRIHHSHLSENPFRDRISQNSRIGTDGGILQHFLFAVSIVIIKKHSKNRASCLYYDPRNSNGHTGNQDLVVKLDLKGFDNTSGKSNIDHQISQQIFACAICQSLLPENIPDEQKQKQHSLCLK